MSTLQAINVIVYANLIAIPIYSFSTYFSDKTRRKRYYLQDRKFPNFITTPIGYIIVFVMYCVIPVLLPTYLLYRWTNSKKREEAKNCYLSSSCQSKLYKYKEYVKNINEHNDVFMVDPELSQLPLNFRCEFGDCLKNKEIPRRPSFCMCYCPIFINNEYNQFFPENLNKDRIIK